MKPILSVIVPVYNVEKYLPRCLDSLVNQTLKNMEIIVINDGTKDNSQQIIDDYASRYPQIRPFKKPNGGIAETRNFGLAQVQGEYFGFLDSDDFTELDMFEKMVAAAEKENADVVVSNFNWVYGEQKRLEKEGPYAPGKEMMIHLFATLWNKIYRTDFVRETGLQFPTGYRYEDACFLYCLAPHVKKLAFVDEAFVSYIQLGNSITHTNNHEVKDMIHVFEIITDYFKVQGWDQEYHDELEYLHIKFFLGNSFLRSTKIADRQDRKTTIQMGWERLNQSFPQWKKNPYLTSLGGMKNRYFKTVSNWNIMLYSELFHRFKK